MVSIPGGGGSMDNLCYSPPLGGGNFRTGSAARTSLVGWWRFCARTPFSVQALPAWAGLSL